MTREKSKVGLVIRGVAMGIAEVIPGVSGGTIAFITGIYEKLIDTITAFGPIAIQGWKRNGLKGLWSSVNGDFLFWLLLGMVGGFGIGILGITYLMEHFPEPLWAFFFGLILASAIYISKQIKHWDVQKILAVIIGAIIAFVITTLTPVEGNTNSLYVFLSGMIAISALMLPGISGSFILLIMGMYTIIIPLINNAISDFDTSGFFTLSIFGMGCLVGLAGFSRIISWLFKKYREITFALLTGFLFGALGKVWPWRNISSVLDKSTGKVYTIKNGLDAKSIDIENSKILSENIVLPSQYFGETPLLLPVVVSFFIGVLIVFLLDRFEEAS